MVKTYNMLDSLAHGAYFLYLFSETKQSRITNNQCYHMNVQCHVVQCQTGVSLVVYARREHNVQVSWFMEYLPIQVWSICQSRTKDMVDCHGIVDVTRNAVASYSYSIFCSLFQAKHCLFIPARIATYEFCQHFRNKSLTFLVSVILLKAKMLIFATSMA